MRAVLPIAAGCLAALTAGCGGASVASLKAARLPDARLPPPAAAAPPAVASARTARPTARRPARGPASPAPAPAGAPTDAEVAAELKQAFKGSGKANVVDAATVGSDGLASIPLTAPPKLRALITAANQVARKPYVYGGGHGGGGDPEGIWTDTAYDCSGSISYALASAGFLKAPMASGPLETFGKPGPGKWVTIYANAGHAWMVAAGLRFDTSGRAERGTRWQSASRSTSGFTVRHPVGL
jgi:cell wall-associated NlpC family hydrolase